MCINFVICYSVCVWCGGGGRLGWGGGVSLDEMCINFVICYIVGGGGGALRTTLSCIENRIKMNG